MRSSFFSLVIIGSLSCWGWADEGRSSAIGSAMSCLPLVTGDEFRVAKTQGEAARTLARVGAVDLSRDILKNIKYYSAPSFYVESILAGFTVCSEDSLQELVRDGLRSVPLADGRDRNSPQAQLLKIGIALNMANIEKEALSVPGSDDRYLAASQARWKKVYEVSWISLLLDGMTRRDPWKGLSQMPPRENLKEWKDQIGNELFQVRLLMAAALQRQKRDQPVPASWVTNARRGLDTPLLNSNPARIALDLGRLAAQERREADAINLWSRLEGFLGQLPVTSFGMYEVIRDAAMASEESGFGRTEIRGALNAATAKVSSQLNDYEKMLVYPNMAEGYAHLGDMLEAEKLWQKTIEIIEKMEDRESQAIGLTRCWLSYVGAGRVPSAQLGARLEKIKKTLPGVQ